MTSYEQLQGLIGEGPVSVWLGGGVDGPRCAMSAEDRRRSLESPPSPPDLARLLYLSRLWELESGTPPQFRGVVTTAIGTTLERLVCAVTGHFPHVITNRRDRFLPSSGVPTRRPAIVHILDDELWCREAARSWPVIGTDLEHVSGVVRDTTLFVFGWDDLLADQVRWVVNAAKRVVWCGGLGPCSAIPLSLQAAAGDIVSATGVDLLIWSAAASDLGELGAFREGAELSALGLRSTTAACGDWLSEYRQLAPTEYDRGFLKLLPSLPGMTSLWDCGDGEPEKAIEAIEQALYQFDACTTKSLQKEPLAWFLWADAEDRRREETGAALLFLPDYAPDDFLEDARPALALALHLTSCRHRPARYPRLPEEAIRSAVEDILSRCRAHFSGSCLIAIEAAYEFDVRSRWERAAEALSALQSQPERNLLSDILKADSTRLHLRRDRSCTPVRHGQKSDFETIVKVSRPDRPSDEPFQARWIHEHRSGCPIRPQLDLPGVIVDDALGGTPQAAYFLWSNGISKAERMHPRSSRATAAVIGESVSQLSLPEASAPVAPINVLISHSEAPEDVLLVDKCLQHLTPLVTAKNISIMQTICLAGDPVDSKFFREIDEAQVMLVMISIHYLNRWGDFDHLARARKLAAAGTLRLIPVLLRSCLPGPEYPLADLVHRPARDTSVADLASSDAFWKQIAVEVDGACQVHREVPRGNRSAGVIGGFGSDVG